MLELICFSLNSLGPKRAISRGGFADRPMACECNHTLVSAWRFFANAHFINEPLKMIRRAIVDCASR